MPGETSGEVMRRRSSAEVMLLRRRQKRASLLTQASLAFGEASSATLGGGVAGPLLEDDVTWEELFLCTSCPVLLFYLNELERKVRGRQGREE